MIVYFEDFPRPMTAAQINGMGRYRDFTSDKAVSLGPWQLKQDPESGVVEIRLKFSKRGLYYTHIYLSEQPFKRGSGSASTKGKIRASGLVIRVAE